MNINHGDIKLVTDQLVQTEDQHVADLAIELIERLAQQRDELIEVFNAVINELDKRKSSNGVDAPGHWHRTPGIWDNDNGALAGKPCGWCATWKKAKEIRQANVKGGA